MKTKKNLNIKTTKLSFEKTTVLELNQLRNIKGGGDNHNNDGNNNTHSITDVANGGGQANYSIDCPPK